MAAYPKLTLSSIGTTSVKFKIATSSWEGDTFYVFYRDASDSSDSNWKTVSGYSYGETFSITGLESGTKYAFRVSELDDFTGEYGSGTLSNKTTSSSAFDCGYFTTVEEVDTYTYTFKNNSDYPIYLKFYSDVISSTSMTISAGGSKTITCEPGDIEFDPDACKLDGKTGYADCIYWQRTSPTTGTKYCLDSTDGAYITLRSSSNATYTFTVSGYSPSYTYYATLEFDANGGSGAPSDVEESAVDNSAISITIPSTTPTKSGYTFQYWSRGSNIYYPGSTYTFTGSTSGSTYTLTAVWATKLYYVTLTFDPGDGSGRPDSAEGSGTSSSVSVTIPDTEPTLTGYTFLYWTRGSTKYYPGSSYTFTGSESGKEYVLTAVYEVKTVTITFRHYRGGALYTTTTDTVDYGETVTVSSYKISSIPNCVYDSASVSSFTATADRTVNLYYIFKWTYAKTKGVEFNLTATEWNNLCAFVNAQRSAAYSFTTAVKGNDFTAVMYNQMVSAIGAGTTVEKGDIITAALMNALVTNANNM